MTETPAKRLFYGWYIAAACLLIYLFTNGMSIFVPQNLFPRFMESFAATEGQVSLTTGLMFGVTIFVAPFAGALIDRFGPLRVIRIGLTIMAVCFTAYPFTQSIRQLIAIHIGLGFGLVLGGLLVNVVLLSNWFVRRRGAIIGLLTSMSSLGGLILPNMIAPLVNAPEYGWRWGMGALTVAFWLLAIVPGFFVLRARPADVGQFPDGDAVPARATGTNANHGPEEQTDGVSFGAALRSRTIYVLAIGSACLWFTFQAINSQIQIYLELEAGLPAPDATRLYTTIFGCSVAGKFLFGAISDRFAKRHVMRAASLVLLLGCLSIFDWSGGAPGLTADTARLTLFTVLFGLGYGGSFTMIQLVCVESFGRRALGKLLGIIICIDSAGGMFGTVWTGQMKTATGSYLIPFTVVAIVAFVALINVLLIRPVPVRPHVAPMAGAPPATP
ncbi:MAG: MFS transporter [Gammaproteobacteria bacterium]